MNTVELADLTADPVQVLGASFYFDALTRARGKESGLNSFEYYGLGRGGTLGNVDTESSSTPSPSFTPAPWNECGPRPKKRRTRSRSRPTT